MLTYSAYIYLLLVLVIKLSCLLFYRRVFSPSKRMKWAISAGIYVIVAAYAGVFFSTVFECIPVQKLWHPELHGHCMRPKVLPYASGAINVISDIYVLVIPIPCIWELNLKLYRKLRVLLIFGLGVLYDDSISKDPCHNADFLLRSVCVTSIIRLTMTYRLYGSSDETWNLFQIGIWA